MGVRFDIRSLLIAPKHMQMEEARQEYITQAVFVLTGYGLLATTFVLLITAWTGNNGSMWRPFIAILALDVVFAAGWMLVKYDHWKIARYLPPLLLLTTGFFIVRDTGLMTVGVLRFALAVFLTALLFNTKTQWVVACLSVIAYLTASWIHGERNIQEFIISGGIVATDLGAVALFQWFSSRLLTNALYELHNEINERNKTQNAIQQKEAILAAIAESAQKLLETTNWENEIHAILEIMGKASHASHAYVFKNFYNDQMQLLTSQKYEWVGAGQIPEIDNPDYQDVPVWEAAMSDWYELMVQGKPFYNSTKIFPPEWADTPSRQEIKTLLDVPIFVEGKWWGVIGFDDCVHDLPWSQAEVDAMQAAAGLLGAAIKRQMANETLRASEEKFQTTFHQTFVPMIIGQLSDRTILDVNDAFCKMSGYTLEEALGRRGSELNIWANREEYDQHRSIIEKNGFVHEFKAKYKKKTGQTGTVMLSAAPIQVEGKACLLYTLYDITKIEDLLNELQDKNNELERFTYTVSHDLKAPLITMGGFVGFLEQDVIAGNIAKTTQDVQRIMQAVRKMERLLNELLELSRVGRIVNEPENVLFGEIAEEAVRLVQGQLDVKQVKVQIEAGLPVLCVDRARLIEVMQNLVDNASKFMGRQINPEIKIGARKQDGAYVLFVADNGIGIEPVYHERVFRLFDKLDAKTDGTGIGLALVKRIIEFHGGRIWIESKGAGAGTTFCFTLPLAS